MYLVIPEFDVAYQHCLKWLDKLCVKLCIALLNHQLYGNNYESAIVSFLAVLGINPKGGMFREPQNYTGDLSAVIKVAQLLVIWQSIQDVKDGKADYPSTSIEDMHNRFMTFDGRTPMAWILGLRAYGKKLAEARTTDGDIVWSNCYKSISFKGFDCTLSNFRCFVMTLLKKVQEQMASLFLIQAGEKMEIIIPVVRLFAIKDIPRESR